MTRLAVTVPVDVTNEETLKRFLISLVSETNKIAGTETVESNNNSTDSLADQLIDLAKLLSTNEASIETLSTGLTDLIIIVAQMVASIESNSKAIKEI